MKQKRSCACSEEQTHERPRLFGSRPVARNALPAAPTLPIVVLVTRNALRPFITAADDSNSNPNREQLPMIGPASLASIEMPMQRSRASPPRSRCSGTPSQQYPRTFTLHHCAISLRINRQVSNTRCRHPMLTSATSAERVGSGQAAGGRGEILRQASAKGGSSRGGQDDNAGSGQICLPVASSIIVMASVGQTFAARRIVSGSAPSESTTIALFSASSWNTFSAT